MLRCIFRCTIGRRLLAECRKVSTPSQGEANSQDDDVSADKDEARLGEGSDVQEGTRSPPGDSGSVNVLVTSGVLIPSIVKCLLFKLNDFIDCDKSKLQTDDPSECIFVC